MIEVRRETLKAEGAVRLGSHRRVPTASLAGRMRVVAEDCKEKVWARDVPAGWRVDGSGVGGVVCEW